VGKAMDTLQPVMSLCKITLVFQEVTLYISEQLLNGECTMKKDV